MAQVADKLWTLEEFLAFDDGNDTSYQLFEGRIVAMNPPLRGHGTLVARLTAIVTSTRHHKSMIRVARLLGWTLALRHWKGTACWL